MVDKFKPSQEVEIQKKLAVREHGQYQKPHRLRGTNWRNQSVKHSSDSIILIDTNRK